ncbi:MAG: DUF885 domain-containing protein [Actinomycetes bacterium]|nr:DUF885 domain-containing protein [Actinomycetes bacterium]MDX5380050.1 DUF885 domain-containing protein [Actinomycetes bacterium]MDX5398614.1 DUF885 domain-containing protein [Actinomycetes bacterium]MDX5449761.1 DUF885 domain-containing protein [Actinomycetes bacterium]
MAALDPIGATSLGLPGHDHELPDFSPQGAEARADAQRELLSALASLEPADAVDAVTKAAMEERHGLQLEIHDAGEHLRDLNVIASPVQEVRDIFDLMAHETTEDWEVIAKRLSAVPAALDGYMASLAEGRRRGTVPALRQVEAVIKQADELADSDESFFTSFVAGARPDGREPGAALGAALEQGARDARQAYADLAAFLGGELAPNAPTEDAVGRERYLRFSRLFLGATIDLDETYEWGREELARVVAEQEAVAAELYGPGTTPEEAMARLDQDPARQLHGTDALQRWMQETADHAVATLKDVHFDIPEPVQRIECMIAPTQTGGIYYTGPTADFSRPGRMWWSVPPGVTEFSTWREKTTVYHEGVPGHHLQIAQTVYRSALLNMWRRMYSWVSGHGEGWALYAERLMDELGYLSEPGDRMGMLDGQRLRAARVVLDLGVHLGKPAPEYLGGGTWDADKAWTFLDGNANMAEGFLRFELDRYLGWPGQAPSYKVGQRLWEQIRDEARTAAGEDFSLKDFHRRALDIGSVGLDTLRDALRG